jgi:hypothetical protein
MSSVFKKMRFATHLSVLIPRGERLMKVPPEGRMPGDSADLRAKFQRGGVSTLKPFPQCFKGEDEADLVSKFEQISVPT